MVGTIATASAVAVSCSANETIVTPPNNLAWQISTQQELSLKMMQNGFFPDLTSAEFYLNNKLINMTNAVGSEEQKKFNADKQALINKIKVETNSDNKIPLIKELNNLSSTFITSMDFKDKDEIFIKVAFHLYYSDNYLYYSDNYDFTQTGDSSNATIKYIIGY